MPRTDVPPVVSVKPGSSRALEGIDLEMWLLAGGGDAAIAEQVSHGHDGRRTP